MPEPATALEPQQEVMVSLARALEDTADALSAISVSSASSWSDLKRLHHSAGMLRGLAIGCRAIASLAGHGSDA